MNPKNNGLPGGETHKGTPACRQSGSKSKGGTFAFCKFSVSAEAGQLSNPSPRVMHATSVIPSFQWRRQNTMSSSMTWCFGELRAMSLRGDKRAPKHSQRSLCANAGSPTGRESYGDGILIVPEPETKPSLAQGRSNPKTGIAFMKGAQAPLLLESLVR